MINQYADDSTLFLYDDESSLNSALETVDKFYHCSGLKANFDKTQIVWIGSKKGSTDILQTNKEVIWNKKGAFKVLGIDYALQKDNMVIHNFHNKIDKMKKVVNAWSFRNLSLIGRTTVIKTLVLPIIIQCLTVLPDPPDYINDQSQNMLYNFLWCDKPDKI